MSTEVLRITHYASLITAMRLDLFLKLSRLCPRRTVAQKLCDAGFVFVNDREAKSAHSVKVGDRITLKRRDMQTEVRVLSVPDTRNVAKRDAHDLVELVSQKEFEPWD